MVSSGKKRVVVTGIGAVTPLACTFGEAWARLRDGISGIKGITRFDPSLFSWKIAGEVRGFEPLQFLSRKELLRLDLFVHYAVASAVMAAEDAGLTGSPVLRQAGVVIGSSRGGITTLEREAWKTAPSARGQARVSAYLMASTTVGMAASTAAQKVGAKGHCCGLSNACASGTTAIGEAYRLISQGYAPVAFAGGADAPLCRLALSGYGSAGALSLSGSRPFDRSRDGFVLAEGACVMVLEEYNSALRRGARIYGEIAGYGNASDAFHMIKPDAGGESQAILSALRDAGLSEEEVDYVSAHGTSTPLGDRTEAEAIRAVWGARAASLPVSAIKSMTGHMLGASGALEAACALMVTREGVIPPTINLLDKDPLCDLNVMNRARTAAVRAGVVHSFGFGGVNAVLVIKALS